MNFNGETNIETNIDHVTSEQWKKNNNNTNLWLVGNINIKIEENTWREIDKIYKM